MPTTKKNANGSVNGKTLTAKYSNIQAAVEGHTLTLTIDLSKEFGRSGSGKSTIIATTSGNQVIPGHDDVYLGVNLYRKN